MALKRSSLKRPAAESKPDSSATKVVTRTGAGRPTLYKPEYADQTFSLCLLGATDEDLARSFDVSNDTITEWKKVHPEFSLSIKAGKEEADAKIAKSLYQTALSGNTTAQIFWLKNRKSSLWRDKQEVDHTTGGVSFNIDLGTRRAQERKTTP